MLQLSTQKRRMSPLTHTRLLHGNSCPTACAHSPFHSLAAVEHMNETHELSCAHHPSVVLSVLRHVLAVFTAPPTHLLRLSTRMRRMSPDTPPSAAMISQQALL
eukprot:scaffold2689_cov23-Tisochrysis_lutea.AAC.1